PLAALVFRRGWLFSVALLAVCIAPAPPSVAATGTAAQAWQNLWQTPEQQAAKALSDGDFARASALANDPLRRGSAHYKHGDYVAALADFGQAQGAEASYNRGNALAKLGRYQDALSAYDEALQAHPGMDDAAANKAAVEALLAQQRPAQQQQEQQNAQQERNQQSNQGSEQPPQQQGGSGKQTQPDQQGAPEQHDQAGAGGERSAQQSAAGADEGGEKPDQAAATQGDDAARQASSGERNAARELPGESQTADNGKAAHGVSPQAENDGSTGAQTQAEEQRPPDIQQERSDDQDRNAFADALEELTRRGDREEASGAAAAQTPQADTQPSAGGSGAAEALNSEERLAAEQWLRRIPDDPGGLLRRKFQYQYQQRHGGVDSGSRQGW
ncbi:MAG: tetratricopeptide repeat protein, partial [Gammaproteobacteria bacterium]|nr:tetratricopeptide repeat protein [Gammaproteobacteria bacterium]